MIEKNFIYNMKIYQLLSAVTFRDSPAHPVSFVSKHGYDWLNAYKQLEVWKYFSAQLESIVVTRKSFRNIVPWALFGVKVNKKYQRILTIQFRETWPLWERLVSSIRIYPSPNWDFTRCQEEQASRVDMTYLLQMFFGQLSKFDKKARFDNKVMS